MEFIEKPTDEQMKERDMILFGFFDKEDYYGGSMDFSDLHVDRLKKLVELGYADVEECQNNSPTIGDFIEFCDAYPEFTLHGYAITNERDDCRVTIEGVDLGKPVDDKAIKDFVEMFRFADDFNLETGYVWYD